MFGWHCDKCAPGWPLLEWWQRGGGGGGEYRAGTPFKLSSKSCTNSERITLQAWWRRWWSWRWWCWWWWWEQEDGGVQFWSSDVIFSFNPIEVFIQVDRLGHVGVVTQFPSDVPLLPPLPPLPTAWWKNLGQILLHSQPTFRRDPPIPLALSSKIKNKFVWENRLRTVRNIPSKYSPIVEEKMRWG